MKKTKALINTQLVSGLLILDISKRAMYGFWYYYINCNMGKKIMLHGYNNFMACIETRNIDRKVVKDVEIRFYTSNQELHRPLTRKKIKKWLH